MNDNDVIAILITVIRTGLASLGLRQVAVKQSFQPTQTAVESGQVVYLHKITAPRYGFPGRFDVYQPASRDFKHTETIYRTPTFQIDGLSRQDPSNINQITASDLVEQAADVLQTSTTREALLRSCIGIERITAIRENYFLNSQDHFEQIPSFDFVVNYRREIESTAQQVTQHTLNTRRIC